VTNSKRSKKASSKSGPPRDPTHPPTDLLTLPQLADSLGIKGADLILCGDGSGSTWQLGCGWACLIFERASGARYLTLGGMNLGSVNLAELMAYTHALTWWHATRGLDMLHRKGRLSVHIITDSQLTVNLGMQVAAEQPLPAPNRAYWAAMREMQRTGFFMHWHHVHRNLSYGNWLCDLVSSEARRAAMGIRDLLVDADGQVLSLVEPPPPVGTTVSS
jgi:ribonuclease HI